MTRDGALSDAATFWTQFSARPGSLTDTLAQTYPLVPRPYVERFMSALSLIEGDPQVLTYVESDLGAIGRAQSLIDVLIGGGVRVEGARCLDIGCSNGALLRAARARGASRCVGIDISDERLVSARMVCGDDAVELLVADARRGLPGEFDLVLCTDVLEHVPEWRDVLAQIAGALAPCGAAWISLHNARHRSSVLSEPHFGVPGLCLLPADEAAPLWERVRERLGNRLAYDVFEWPSFADIDAAAASLGLTRAPWTDIEWMTASFWKDVAARWGDLERDVAAAFDRLGLPPDDARRLDQAVREYGARLLDDHARFDPDADDRLGFYMRYYAQPLNVLLRRE